MKQKKSVDPVPEQVKEEQTNNVPDKKTEEPKTAREERVFQFTKRETADKEPETIMVKESELDADQLEATYRYLMMIFNGSPFLTQRRFIDEVMMMVADSIEHENTIIAPDKTIVDANGAPMKSPLKKV